MSSPFPSGRRTTRLTSSHGSDRAHRHTTGSAGFRHGNVPCARPPQLPWERMTCDELEATLARMHRQSVRAYSLRSPVAVHELLSPVSMWVPSGSAELDALLSSWSSSPSSSGYHAAPRYRNVGNMKGTGEASETLQGHVAFCAVGAPETSSPSRAQPPAARRGGWPVGAISEVFGPPLSGKTFLLRQTASAFVHAQCAAQQQQLQRYQQPRHYMAQQAHSHATTDVLGHVLDRNDGCCNSPVTTWDLYVCLITPAGGHDGNRLDNNGASNPEATATAAWADMLSAATATATAAAIDDIIAAKLRTYAKDHTHIVNVSHPNELLQFLAWLGDSLDTQAEPPKLGAASDVEGRGESVAANSTERISQAGAHHVLLVVDSLAVVWQHPSLQANRHAVAWYAHELVRRLRRCLSRRQVHGVCHVYREGNNKHESDTRHGIGDTADESTSSLLDPHIHAFPATCSAVLTNGSTPFQSFRCAPGTSTYQQQQRLNDCSHSNHNDWMFPMAVPQQQTHPGGPVDFFAPQRCTAFIPASCGVANMQGPSPSSLSCASLFPLGEERWFGSVDCRVLLTPADIAVNAIFPPPQVVLRGRRRCRGLCEIEANEHAGGEAHTYEDAEGDSGNRSAHSLEAACAKEGPRSERARLVAAVPAMGSPMTTVYLTKMPSSCRGGEARAVVRACTIRCQPGS